MKNKTVLAKFTLPAALALALGALAFTPSLALDRGTGGPNASGYPSLPAENFAQKIAGSYLVDFPDGSRLLLQLDQNGGTHRESSDDFIGLSGLPDLPFHFSSGGFGNWTRTGPRTIRLVELSFQFGSDGLVGAIAKTAVEIQFDAALRTATGVAAVAVYLPTQDPLTDEPAFPGPSFSGAVLRRIQ